MKHPIDNLFRPPVELVSAATALGATVALVNVASTLGLSSAVTFAGCANLLAISLWRARQALRVLRFQRNLRLLPTYQVTSDEIPWSPTEMFLGRGFWWEPHHTQRLYMARWPQHRHLRARNDRYLWARRFARQHPLNPITKVLNWPSPWNPFAPLPPVGGDPAIHGIEPDEHDVWSTRQERVGHTLVLGTTRVGKTRLAELLITQDIRAGNVVIVFDPKGDVELLKRMYAEAKRAGRLQDFYFFHLGYPDISNRYNPIAAIGRVTEVATRVANPLPGEGNSAAFKQFVWLYVNIIARAATALGLAASYELIYRYAADLDSLASQYLHSWLHRAHPGWEQDLDEVVGNLSEKAFTTKVQQTGRTTHIIELMELVQSKGWNDDAIANGLLAVLANNKSKYQALINSLLAIEIGNERGQQLGIGRQPAHGGGRDDGVQHHGGQALVGRVVALARRRKVHLVMAGPRDRAHGAGQCLPLAHRCVGVREPIQAHHHIAHGLGEVVEQGAQQNAKRPDRCPAHLLLWRRPGRQFLTLANGEGVAGHLQGVDQEASGLCVVMRFAGGQQLHELAVALDHGPRIGLPVGLGQGQAVADHLHLTGRARDLQQLLCSGDRQLATRAIWRWGGAWLPVGNLGRRHPERRSVQAPRHDQGQAQQADPEDKQSPLRARTHGRRWESMSAIT